MIIRNATLDDLAAVSEIEAACFPAAEAADAAAFRARLSVYPDHFWLLQDDAGRIVSFIDGLVTDEALISDDMFEDAVRHNENGTWQTIMGVNTLPEYRKRGYAAQVMEKVIADAHAQKRKGCVLTCKAALIPYYSKFGYKNEGVSESVHGGAVWYDMRLTF